MIKFTVVVAGTVDEFNRTNYKERLAKALGLRSTSIELVVTAASLNVEAIITPPTDRIDKVLRILEGVSNGSAAAASELLGVQVESLGPPIVAWAETPDLITDTQSVGITADGRSHRDVRDGATEMVVFIVLPILLVVMLAIGVNGFRYCMRRRASGQASQLLADPNGSASHLGRSKRIGRNEQGIEVTTAGTLYDESSHELSEPPTTAASV